MKKVFVILVFLFAVPLCAVIAQRPNTVSAEVVSIDGGEYYVHQVREGETLSSLARVYDVTVKEIEEDNPVIAREGGLKAGQVLRIRCETLPELKMSRRQYNRTFDEHIVEKGETAYSIARRYLLSLTTLVEDNPGLDPANIQAGLKLRIRKSGSGESSPESIREEIGSISNKLNRLSEDYFYHVVDIGETIYSLSREWGIEESVILANNDVSGGLKAGTILKVPAQGKEELKTQLVEVPLDPDDNNDNLPPLNYSYDRRLDIAMLLPLWDNGVRSNFIEFYQGALLALEDFKISGYSINFDLYDTERSPEKVEGIVRSGVLSDADLIIGPVYEDEFEVVAGFARGRNIPLVSPLSSLNGRYTGPVYQMPSSHENKYDKLKDIFNADKNIVLISTEDNDDEFERDMLGLIGSTPYQKLRFTKGLPSEYMDSMVVSTSRSNIIVVTSRDEVGVDMVLATISSIQNNRKARSMRTAPVQVIGNSRWTRYSLVDRNLFFKLNVTFVASYHSDRSNDMVNNFDRRYIAAFSTVPSLYSYRGYDSVRMFAEAMLTGNRFTAFDDKLNSAGRPLQTGYVFRRNERGFMENMNWSLVRYRDNYTIEVR